MLRHFLLVLTLTSVFPLAHASKADPTRADAEAMVASGIQSIKTIGMEVTFKEISKAGGRFTEGELYLVVYSMKGVVLAHGANPRMIGKDLIDIKDVDGKAFVRERVTLAESKGKFWHEYRFPNPVTKVIEEKLTYCMRQQDFIVCGGIYK